MNAYALQRVALTKKGRKVAERCHAPTATVECFFVTINVLKDREWTQLYNGLFALKRHCARSDRSAWRFTLATAKDLPRGLAQSLRPDGFVLTILNGVLI